MATVQACLIVGNDPLLITAELEKVLEKADQFSINEFVASNPFEEVVQTLATPAMFGERRFVVLRGVDELTADVARELIAYLEAPAPGATLILVASKPVPKIAAAVKKVGRVVEAGKGKRADVYGWLKEKAKLEGLRISAEGMTALLDAVGDERMALGQAVDELALALPANALVTPKQVYAQFRSKTQISVFAFIDAVAIGQTGSALEALHRLLSQSEAPQLLLWSLVRHFRMLLIAGEGTPVRVSQALGVPPWRAEKLCRQARTFTANALLSAYQSLALADRKMKKSEEPEALTLERAVVEITTRKSNAASEAETAWSMG